MTDKTLRAAVIGLGMGRHHLKAYSQIPGVEVAALCDADEAVLTSVAGDYPDAQATTDWRDIVRDRSVDVVSVCTPDRHHFEQASALVLAGKHVLCEKPMVVSEQEARTLIHNVREMGVAFAVGNVNRFVPQFRLAANYAHEGRLGDLFMVESDYIHDMRRVFTRTPWRVDPEAPQDAIFGGGVHPIDLARWVAGEVTGVFACGNHRTVPEYNSPDNILISLQFASGCVGKVWITFGIQRRPEHVVNLNVFGAEGTLYSDSERAEARLYLPGLAEGQHGWATIPFEPIIGHPVRAELAHLVECIRTGRQPLVDVLDGARTTAVLEAARRSLQAGLPFPVANVERPLTRDEQLVMRCSSFGELPEVALPDGYSIRPFQASDTRAWLDICNPAIGTTWTEADFGEKMLKLPWYSPDRVFMVVQGDEPVGTATAWQDTADEQQVGYTHMVAVRPDQRWRGLGRALMIEVMRWFRDHGYTESILNTDDFRLPAIAMYYTLGFEGVADNEFTQRRWRAIDIALQAKKLE